MTKHGGQVALASLTPYYGDYPALLVVYEIS